MTEVPVFNILCIAICSLVSAKLISDNAPLWLISVNGFIVGINIWMVISQFI